MFDILKSNLLLTAKTKLLRWQSIWLLQDYPYYENFMNAGLEKGADT